MKATIAEFFGTFWLVLGGCGSAVIAGSHVGFLGVSFAFGLTVLAFLTAIDRPEWFRLKPATGTAAAMVYASGHRS